MKKANIYFTILKIILDYLIILGMFFVAREIRLVTDLLPNVDLPIKTISTLDLTFFALVWSTVLFLIFLAHWLYKFDSSWGRVKEYSKVFIYSFYSFVFFTVVVYLWTWFIFINEIPRLIIGFTFFFWSFLLIWERFCLSVLRNLLYSKWILKKSKIFIIWDNKVLDSNWFILWFKNSNEYKIKWVSDNYKSKISEIKNYSYEWLMKLIEKRKIDELLYVNSHYTKEELNNIWELSRVFGIKYRYIANNFDLAKTNTTMSLINDIPALEIKNTTLSGWNYIIKRFFDFVTWFVWVILFLPIMVIISILIKIEDPKWPIIFKNKRVGRDWKEFDLYKFRYMKWEYCNKDSYNVSEKDKNIALEYEKKLIKKSSKRKGPLYKIKNDPRKTKIWTFIEKYSLDEIPQFFNIILWNMSLVWPRPHQSREVSNYSLEHNKLLTIKPGITWMAQVNWREDNSFDDEVNLDIYYIENWSVLLDIKIIIKTFYVVLIRK